MVDIDFTVVTTADGEKLVLDFPYNEDLISKITDELAYRKTEYGFHDPTDDDPPLEDTYDEKTWYVSLTKESLIETEKCLNVDIPETYWPTDGERNSVRKKVDETGSLTIQIINGFSHISVPITDTTEKIVDNAECLSEFDETGIDESTYILPIGMKPVIEERLIETNTEYSIENQCNPSKNTIGAQWKHTCVNEAEIVDRVNDCITTQRGIIETETGHEASAITARMLFELNTKTTVIAVTDKKATTWKQTLSDQLDVSVQRLRNKKEDAQTDVIVTSVGEIENRGVTEAIKTSNVVVVDEIFRMNAETVVEITESANAEYRFGLCTPRQRDELRKPVTNGFAQTILSWSTEGKKPLTTETLQTEYTGRNGDAESDYRTDIVYNPHRAQTIAGEMVSEITEGNTVTVIVDSNEEKELLMRVLSAEESVDGHLPAVESGYESVFMTQKEELKSVSAETNNTLQKDEQWNVVTIDEVEEHTDMTDTVIIGTVSPMTEQELKRVDSLFTDAEQKKIRFVIEQKKPFNQANVENKEMVGNFYSNTGEEHSEEFENSPTTTAA